MFTVSARKANARKKQRTVEEDIEEESEILPQTKSARQIDLERKKKVAGAVGQGNMFVARKPTPVKSFTKMSVKEYTEYRERNPYLIPRRDNVANPRFYTDDQERVYDEVFLS